MTNLNIKTKFAVAALALFMAGPAIAAVPSNLDQYGCRVESAGYRCYTGANNGHVFKNQQDMISNASGNSTMGKNMGSNTTTTTGAAGNVGSGAGVISNGSGANRSGGGASQNTPTAPANNSGGPASY